MRLCGVSWRCSWRWAGIVAAATVRELPAAPPARRRHRPSTGSPRRAPGPTRIAGGPRCSPYEADQALPRGSVVQDPRAPIE